MEWNLGDHGKILTLADMDDWREFVDANKEWIDEIGGEDAAYTKAVQGGLRYGGGAMPIVDICFEM